MDNSVIFYLYTSFFPWGWVIPLVLSSISFSVLCNKVSQYSTYIRSISGAVDETGFWFFLWAIYILFLKLSRSILYLRVSLRKGGFSYIIPDGTSTVGICLGRFLIRRSDYTFVNRLYYFYTLKHINSLLKLNGFTIKDLIIGLFRPAIRHAVWINHIQFS